MALSIKNQEIIGEIDNLQDKLDGKLPIDRLELLYLVNSWGRTNFFYTEYLNEDVKIEKHREKECYDLSKLDVSQITNMDSVFCFSNFTDIHSTNGIGLHNDIHSTNGIGLHNGNINNWDVSNVTNMLDMFFFATNFNQDISKWDVSNVTNMSYMFYEARSFNNIHSSNGVGLHNQDLNNWDVSKVTEMIYMFANTLEFNQNISSWNFDNIINCDFMFNKAESFLDKYNSGEPLPNRIDQIKRWFKENSDKMNAIDIKEQYGDEIEGFFNKLQTNSIQKKEI